MNKKEYQQLVDSTIGLVKAELDEDLRNSFEEYLEPDFRRLPKHKETIRTLQGIVGFYNHCATDEKRREAGFVFNALHDLRECTRNYRQPWFSPRLSRFAK